MGPGTYVHDIYAGAGQCDTRKGKLVGTLTINYDGFTLTANVQMNGSYIMDETHFYAGSEILPRNNGEYTVAPGQYPQIHDLTKASSDTFTATGLSGDVYVVVHAVVGCF